MTERKLLIGMVHVGALPGTPHVSKDIATLVSEASRDASILRDAGFDAVIVENMHDAPYLHGVQGPEIVASMTRVALAVREAVPELQLGIQILSGGAKEALAIALAVGGSFIRVENFVFAHVADEGLLERAEAGPLLRYRRAIGAQKIHLYADIKKKHASHAITNDVSLAESVEAAMFFGADGVIVTGAATGKPAALADVQAAKAASNKPVLVGSGANAKNAAALLTHADGLIVGSSIKVAGTWTNPVDPARAKEFIKAARA
jgi:membrane complex biogenesis BtpA family protein